MMKLKSFLKKPLFLLYLLWIATACNYKNDPNMIWDIYPTIIYISVEDTQGNSLLDPKVEGNILENGIKIIYQGKTYEKDSLYDGLSRAYLARFYGIKTDSLVSGLHVLSIGEFAGDKNYKNEEITIDWNDGSKDIIAFDSELSWKNKKPSVKRTLYLNGKKTENNPILIVK